MSGIGSYWAAVCAVVAVVAYAAQAAGGSGSGDGGNDSGGRRRLWWTAVAAHAAALAAVVSPDFRVGLGAVISAFMWLTVVGGGRAAQLPRIRRLLCLAAAAAVIMPWLLPVAETAPPLSLHAALALLAYAFAAIAALYWLDIHQREAQLRAAPETARGDSFLGAEKHCFYYVAAAFVVLSLTLLSGLASLFEAAGAQFEWTHKNLFALLTWGVFAVLLIGRYLFHWRGQRAKRWFAVGYAFLLLSYIGSQFVLQVILNRL